MIELVGIRRSYELGGETIHALDGIDEVIASGAHVAVMGPSGSGKSTLLNVIGCLDRPTAGSYRLDGREVAVTALRFWVIEHGVIPASRGGKAKTVAQTVAITMYLVDVPPVPWWEAARAIAMGVAVALTLVTGIDYALRARRLRHVAAGEITDDGAVR